MEVSRFDRVQVDVAGEIVEISWDERDTLLGKLRSVAGSVAVGAKFEAVGASRPVELDGDERAHLRTVLELWASGCCRTGSRSSRRWPAAYP
jgi:hypothetical protein